MRKKEVRIALAAIVALVLMFFGLNFLKGVSLFSNNTVYYLELEDVSGATVNCPVFADGVKIGRVSKIEYDYTHEKPTRLTLAVNKEMRIPKGSAAEVKSDLMGNTHVNLLLANNPRERVNPGEIIFGSTGDGTIDKLKAMIPAMEKMVPKIDSIMTNLNAVLGNPAIAQIMTNTEGLTQNLATSSVELSKMLRELSGTVPGVMQKADGVMANTEVITQNLAAVDVEATMGKLNTTLADLQNTIAKLNTTEGTAGKLLNDPELYNHLSETVKDADSLLLDLKEHPKRYVHFSVFGKKDK